ncbi:TAF6-like RNA polymerase II p300/CBP-associated factor-associated factor 65 kDa subunit 6L [Diadema antillarum]|uniref:TAF6-like RNA polymerase II p300/CBP-associated factor-associated factor 65 kDa subunit 6L n=1 Tax=Diadema antillarum TaxID=105358 RepID=UPI003A84EB89
MNSTEAKPQIKQEDRSKTVDEKKYALFSKDSIKIMAESAGFDGVSDEIAATLAEDVCYRLREAVQASAQFMKHSKRKRMTTEDFNKALRWSDVEPIHGYGSNEPSVFRQVKDTELYFAEDRDLSLSEIAMDTKTPLDNGRTSLKANWLTIEGVNKVSASHSDQGLLHTKDMLSSDQVIYYQQLVRAVLGTDNEAAKTLLNDLQTSSKIACLLPSLVNFVSEGVKIVSLELHQLKGLLYVVDALVRNKFLYLGPYMIQLVSMVMYCILEPLAVSINPLNDHWGLRDFAARLLQPILRCAKDSKSKFYQQMLTALQEVLNDPARPLCTYYGAVMGLIALGPQAIEEVLCPQLATYWVTLQQVLEETAISQVKADGHKVHGALLMAAETLLRYKYHEGVSDPELPSQISSPCDSPRHLPEFAFGTASRVIQLRSLSSSGSLTPPLKEKSVEKARANGFVELYTELYSYFGDSLSVRLGIEVNVLQVLSQLDKRIEHSASLNELVNERVTFDGTMFRRHRPNATNTFPPPPRSKVDAAEEAKPKPQSRPPKPGSSTHRSQSLRTRQGKTSKRFRTRSGGVRDAFQPTKLLKHPAKRGSAPQLESRVWQVSIKMPPVGKAKRTKVKRLGMPSTRNLPSIHATL